MYVKYGTFIELENETFDISERTCNIESCRNYEKVINEYCCEECGMRASSKIIEENININDFLYTEFLANDFQTNKFDYESYEPKTLLISGMFAEISDEYSFVDNDFEDLQKTNETFKNIILILKRKSIPYKIRTGFYIL